VVVVVVVVGVGMLLQVVTETAAALKKPVMV
jgi:hypothetical protein